MNCEELLQAMAAKNDRAFLLDNGAGAPVCIITVSKDVIFLNIQHASIIEGVGPEDINDVQMALDELKPFSVYGFFQIEQIKDTLICVYTQRIIGDLASKNMREIYRRALSDGVICLKGALHEIAKERRKQS